MLWGLGNKWHGNVQTPQKTNFCMWASSCVTDWWSTLIQKYAKACPTTNKPVCISSVESTYSENFIHKQLQQASWCCSCVLVTALNTQPYMKSASEAGPNTKKQTSRANVGGREAVLRSQQLGANTPDNPRSKASKKTIFSAPASINVETERRKRKTIGVASDSGSNAVSRSNATSPNFRTSPLSEQPTRSRIKLKNEPVYCRRNIVHARRAATRLGPPAEGRSVPSKILEWMRDLLLSQSALLGRPDCNESSQTKRDLLAAPGEPAQATLSGSPLPASKTSSLRVRAACRRTVQRRKGGGYGGWLNSYFFFFLFIYFFLSASLNSDLDWWTVNRGRIHGDLQPRLPQGETASANKRNPSTPTLPSSCQIVSVKTRLHTEFYDSEKQRGRNL